MNFDVPTDIATYLKELDEFIETTIRPLEQKAEFLEGLIKGNPEKSFAFGITEPNHGSDATHIETYAVRQGDDWIINGGKTWNTGIHACAYDLIFARTSGKAGDGHCPTFF